MTGKVRGGDVRDGLCIDADNLAVISIYRILALKEFLHGGAAAPLAMGQEAPWWASW